MRIKATLRYMAANEIAAMIDADRFRQIKQLDPKPIFKAFVVGHEGEAQGVMLGVGNVIKRWFKSAVQSLFAHINKGLQLFHGHAEGTNDTAGRQAIGEVVGKRLMSISGRLSAVVACYIYPSFKHLPLDVASIEAEVDMDEDPKRGLYVADVARVTGIALASSAIETPGFPGATLLGQLQAFAKSHNIGDVMEITIEDVRSFLKAEPVKPSDLFGVEDLTSDPAVKGFVETENRRAVAGEYAHRKRTEEGFDKTRQELEAKVKAAEERVASLAIESAKSKVGDLFAKRKTERKLTDQQARFIEGRLSRFALSKAEALDQEFDTFLDQQIDDFKQVAEVFGVKQSGDRDGKENGGDGDRGTGPSDTADAPALDGPDSEYLDPAKNEFIKTGV